MKSLPWRAMNALIVLLLLTCTVAGGLLVVLPRMTGGAALTVLSGSMTPTYPVGSTVFVRPVTPDDVREGDVITFANPDGRSFTTHRVTEVETTDEGVQFVTKGDANRGEDPQPVPDSALRGRVWFHIPVIGRLRDAVGTPWGLGLIGALAGLSAIWEPVTSFVRRRNGPASLPQWMSRRPAAATSPAAPTARHEELEPSYAEAEPGPPADLAGSPGGSTQTTSVAGPRIGLRSTDRTEQQLLLAHLQVRASVRREVLEVLELVRGQVVAIGPRHMVVSVSGTPDHLDGVEQLLRPCGVLQTQRSPVISIGGEPFTTTPAGEPNKAVGATIGSVSHPIVNLQSLGLVSVAGPTNGWHKTRIDP